MTIDVVCVASWNVDLIAHIPQPLQRGETQLALSACLVAKAAMPPLLQLARARRWA